MIIKIKIFFFWEYIIFSLTFEGNFCKYRNHKLIGISFSDLYRQACCILAFQVWSETCWWYREFFVYDELFFSMWLSGFSLFLGSFWHVLVYTHLCTHPKVLWEFLGVYYIYLSSNLEFSAVLFILLLLHSPPPKFTMLCWSAC